MGGATSIVLRPNLSLYGAGLSAIALAGQYLGKLVLARASRDVPRFSCERAPHRFRRASRARQSILLCVILFAELWRRAHLLSFALLWMFLTLGPVLNARWMPAAVFGERYLYLPSIGFCWLVGWGVVQLWSGNAPALLRPFARAIPVMLAVVALVFAVKTVRRNRDWRSDEVLYRSTIQTQSDSPQIRSNLGGTLFDRGDLDGAEREWLESLSLAIVNPNALDNMALLRQREHRYGESIDYSMRALRANPVMRSSTFTWARRSYRWGTRPKRNGNFVSPRLYLLYQSARTTATESSSSTPDASKRRAPSTSVPSRWTRHHRHTIGWETFIPAGTTPRAPSRPSVTRLAWTHSTAMLTSAWAKYSNPRATLRMRSTNTKQASRPILWISWQKRLSFVYAGLLPGNLLHVEESSFATPQVE